MEPTSFAGIFKISTNRKTQFFADWNFNECFANFVTNFCAVGMTLHKKSRMLLIFLRGYDVNFVFLFL